MVNPSADSAQVQVPPPFFYLGGLALGFVADLGFDLLPLQVSPPMLIAGALLIAAGLFPMIGAGNMFRRRGTDVKPWRPSTALVRDGVFRRTRNPMYLGMAVLYAGLAAIGGSGTALLLLPPVVFIIQAQVIRKEERYLEGKFGDDYRRYKREVRRWI
jgi:protein-S-isoprenylcysteine O-methyltransferase Ste14